MVTSVMKSMLYARISMYVNCIFMICCDTVSSEEASLETLIIVRNALEGTDSGESISTRLHRVAYDPLRAIGGLDYDTLVKEGIFNNLHDSSTVSRETVDEQLQAELQEVIREVLKRAVLQHPQLRSLASRFDEFFPMASALVRLSVLSGSHPPANYKAPRIR